MPKFSCHATHSIFAAAVIFLLSPSVPAGDNYTMRREEMIAAIREMVQETRKYIGKEDLAGEVYEAMARVPRHAFVPPGLQANAYINRPLPIGADQTISQPYIVALMTDLAQVHKDAVVLEVGTGSGYQAAVLAELARQVYTIEIIETLGLRAQATLQRLGYKNITVRIGDGYHGWEEHAPFDAILVTAAAENIPAPLVKQLKPGGRMVIPVGAEFATQTLTLIEKQQDGTVTRRNILPVGFVPLTGEH